MSACYGSGMTRRHGKVVGASALMALGAVALSGNARASVSVAETWEALLHDSSAVAVVTALDSHAVWEGGRIYTYTHVHVDRSVAGELPAGAETYVRTMGGEVGDIGQRVEGEAVLPVGSSSLVFAHRGPPGAYVVTARAQGQFPVEAPATSGVPLRLVRGPSVGALVRPLSAGATSAPRFVVEVVPGRLVDDVAKDVIADWPRLHAPVP